MVEKDLLGAHDGIYDQIPSDDDSDADSDAPNISVAGDLTAHSDVPEELVEDLPWYICTICLQQCKDGETALCDICQHTCLLQVLQWAKAARLTPGPVERRPAESLVARLWPAAATVTSVPTAADTVLPVEEREAVWQTSLGSGASSADDSDWEPDAGAVGTVRRRRRVSRSRALSRLKRCGAPPPASSRSVADRSPPPPPRMPVLHSAGVQPAGAAAGDRPASPSGAPAAHQDVRSADSRLSGVVNGEPGGAEVAGGPGGAPTDGGGGGGPLALKTVIDDGLRPEPERTDDGLEDVSDDEGVEDDQTSPDCPARRTESPPSEQQTAAADPAAGRHASLDDVSDEETAVDNGIGCEAADGGADANGAHDQQEASDTAITSSSGVAMDNDADCTAGGEEEADASPRVRAGTEAAPDTAGGEKRALVAGGGEEATDATPGVPDANEAPCSPNAERETDCSEGTPAALPDEESSDVDSADPVTASASAEVASDAKEEDSDVGTDVEDEPPEPDSLQGRPGDPHPETQASSPNQRLSETGADESQARSDQQEIISPEVITSSGTEQAVLDVDNRPDESRKASDRQTVRENILPGHEYDRVSDSGDDSVAAEADDGGSADNNPVESHKASDRQIARVDILPGHDRVSDSGDDESATADGGPGPTKGMDDSEPSGAVRSAAATDPLASPVYSPVMSPASIHSLDYAASLDRRPPATVAAETPGGHCGPGVADASDVSSDEELVCGESGRPPAEAAADATPQTADSWQLLPVESISSPESFGPDQEEAEKPETPEKSDKPEAEKQEAADPEVVDPEPEAPPAETAAGVEAVAAGPAPAPLLCLGTEQISDNEEDGFDDGMEEGEIPSERPPTPPPPAPVALPPAVPLPLPEPDPQRPLDAADAYPDADLPEGDFEEGEIPSELPPEPAERSERVDGPPAVEADSPHAPAAAQQPPLSTATEPPPEGDYEEGEIVEERATSADELAEDAVGSPPPARPASGGQETAGDALGHDASPVAPPVVSASVPQTNAIDDDDAPDVDEEVRDFVVSEKTITGLEQDEGDDVGWKKFPRNARGRNYRDGKPPDRVAARSKEVAEPRQESRRSPDGDGGRRGKKRDIQRYDVRKVITERKMRAQDHQERGGHARRSRSSSASDSRSPRRAVPRWHRSRSPSRSRSPGRRLREHRRRSRERRSPPRPDRSRHSVSRHSPARLSHSRHSPARLSPSRHSHSRHSLSRSPLHQRTLSPAKKAKDKSRERKRKRSPSPAPATKKLKKRKEKLKKKDEKRKKKKRPKSPISKAVIVDGDNLVVSVNFSSKEHRDRLGTKGRVVRHEERQPSLEFSPMRERPARLRDLPTPSKDKRLPPREPRDHDRDRDLPRRDRDRDERAKPTRASRPERELSPDRQRRDARKENKDPKQSSRAERKAADSGRRSPSPRLARGSKRARSVTPPRERPSPSPRARASSPRAKAPSPRSAPRGRALSPRGPRARLQSARVRATSPRARTPSPHSRKLSPRPRALSPRNRAASPRARSRSRSSERPRKYARRSPSGSRSSSWSCSSASSESPAPGRRRSGSAQQRRSRRSPDLIDLDVIELSPRRTDPIVITDSETEAEPAVRPAQSRAAAPAVRPPPAVAAEPAASASRSTARSPRGPKTPPEPAAAEPTVKFSLSSKLAAVRMITNPLREEDDGLGSSPTAAAAAAAPATAAPAAAAATQPSAATAPRGPSTPPEPPPSDASEAKFGDQYDPFEPTHTPSGTPESPPSPDASPELAASPAAGSPPPLPAEQRDKAGDKPPEPRHPVEAEKRPISKAPPATPPVASLFAGLPPPAAAVSLLSSVLKSVLPDTSRPPPAAAAAPAPASAAQVAPTTAPPPSQNGQRGSGDVIDMDLDSPFSPDSPNSPDSREGDDLFEPPRPARASQQAGRGRRMDPKERFEALFGGSHGRGKAGKAPPGKPVPGKMLPGKAANKQRAPARGGRLAKRAGGKGGAAAVAADDAIKVVDDVPNSAVEMQFLKKLNRQERVIEEVKLVLKPFYHKRTITKEQYKETLRKSVPKICHSKSGEINPKKIHSLIISYVKKCKYNNKKNHISVPNPSTSTPVKGKV